MKVRYSHHKTATAVLLLSALLPLSLHTASVAHHSVASAQVTGPSQGDGVVTRDESGRVRIRFARGYRLDVDNRSAGPIVIVGWDRDYVEALAVSDRGVEEVQVGIEDGLATRRIRVKADYTDHIDDLAGVVIDQIARVESMKDVMTSIWDSRSRLIERPMREMARPSKGGQREESTPKPPSPLYEPPPPDVQAASLARPGEIFLEVRVPRYAALDLIKVFRSEVLVYGVDTDVVVDGQRSTIRIGQVRSTEVHTRSGNIEVESVTENVDLITTSGLIRVKNVDGVVRALSVSGRIEIECARGKVDVSNTSAPIILNGVTGDVTAIGTNGNIAFRGPVRSGGEYSLKSLSGSVEFELPAVARGFTASLTSYRGTVESSFQLSATEDTAAPANSHRISGRYGDGLAKITLDSFEGNVKLVRNQDQAISNCK